MSENTPPRVVCALLLAMLLRAPFAHGQATFGAGVNTVGTYVTVVGDGGTLVTRLTAKDFEIRDDGQPRSITLFEAGLLPITIVVLLDDSPSMRAAQPSTLSAATAFVRRLTPQDRATVGVFSRTVRLEGNLTSDQDELLNRLQLTSPLMAGTALWDAVNAGMTALEGEGGRRVVLLLTDGDDNSSETDASAMAARAEREGIMIYAIGIRGAERRLSKGLRDLARNTGGWFFELKGGDNLTSTFQRVADELHNQYLLGFSLGVLDGKAHRLEVRVKGPGLRARARKSYVASPTDSRVAR
jgi:Ca-activated chloride channel family protein